MTEQTIHPRALPNDLPVESLHLRPDAEGAVRVDPARAGWRYLSFETHHIGRGGLVVAAAGEDVETCLVVLNGGDVSVDGGADRWQLEGRDGPFAGLPSALWRPHGRELRLGL